MTTNSPAYLTNLRQLLNQHFNLAEFRDLCLDLDVDYESLAGEEKPSRIRELLLALGRHGRLPHLIAHLQQERPRIDWPPLPDDFQLPDSLVFGGTAVPATTLLQTYHKQCAAQLSKPRYHCDSRFVQITLLIDQGPDAQGPRFIRDSQRQKYNSLAALLTNMDDNAAVLLGKPGSGKTTLLRRRQLEHARAQLEKPTGHVAFFVPLNSYRRPSPGAPLPAPYDWLAEAWRIYQPRLPDFKTLYENGKILLLLDGLNEMPHKDKTDYHERIALWKTFWQRTWHYGNTVVFSCRSLDYSASLSANEDEAVVRQTQVEPLTPAQIKEFLSLHLGQKGEPAWQTLHDDPQRLALFNAPFFLRLLVDQIAATGDMPTGQAALLTGFVRRALYREIDERRNRLFAPGALLSEDDRQQTRFNAWDSPFDLPAEGGLIPSLERLAYRMQDGREAGEAGLVRAKTSEAKSWLAHEAAAAMIAAGCQLNLLDKDLARREITFYHQLIQEYFAARILARQPEPARLTVPWRAGAVNESVADTVAALDVSDPLPRLPASGWEETALLAAAMSQNQEAFVSDLSGANLPLAARCAAAAAVAVSAALTRRLQEDLIARSNNPQADLRARIAAAEALGELGDPRFERQTGPHGAYLRPPLAKIPAGRYPMGDDNSQYSDEKPAHTVPIAAFEIGVFPVTNAEYGLFKDADGYKDERWWTTEAARAWLRGKGSSEGRKQAVRDVYQVISEWSEERIRRQQATPDRIDHWLWLKGLSPDELEQELEEQILSGEVYRQPEYWDDSQFNHPAQPVVGITWFEARAYCAWLAAQTGDAYRLPTEAEWEAAARGKKGRAYPWGKEYDAARCNTFETHIRGTTPVGVFPDGRTPESVADLSGNVWEWTTTIWGKSLQNPEFSYPYQADDGREDRNRTDVRRALRGGSWFGPRDFARAASRDSLTPGHRFNLIGFRVAVARRPPSHQDH